MAAKSRRGTLRGPVHWLREIHQTTDAMPTSLPPPADPPVHSLGSALERVRARRGLIVGFGVLAALLGLAALVLVETTTIASVLVIGCFMIVAGVLEIVVGLRTRTWGRMLLWEAAGLLYLIAGAFAVAVPALASVVLTLLLGAGLLATGVLRIIVGVRMAGSRTRGGVVAAGLFTALLGLLIVIGWPGNSVLVLGTILGIDLLVYGLTWIVFGFRLGVRHS